MSDDRTKKELIAHAETLGLTLNSAMNRDDMLQIIAIAEERSGANLTAVSPVSNTNAAGPPPGKIRLEIARDGRDKRQRPVFIGHNNIGYLVPRGRPVDFPAVAISALSDAVELALVWDDELETATGLGGERMEARQSYPFNILAFGASTDKVDMDAVKHMLGYD